MFCTLQNNIITLFVFYQPDYMSDEKKNQISIELSENVAEGVYSNLAVITHSATEFVLDFIQVLPGMPKAKVRSRILLTPIHAKRLLRALEDNISKFENAQGEITDSGGGHIPPMNFGGGPPTQA